MSDTQPIADAEIVHDAKPPGDRFSIAALVIANVIPLICVLFFNWQAGEVLVLYWMENLIIGFYNVLKMAFAKAGGREQQMQKLFLIPFFCFHYGMFCMVHGVFVFVLAGMMASGGSNWALAGAGMNPFTGLVQILRHSWVWMIPAAAIVISHGVSFVQNYLIGGECERTSPSLQMFKPYARIVVLHVAIIFGAMPVMLLGSPVILLVLLIGGKTRLDIVMHKKSHGSGANWPFTKLQQLAERGYPK